MSDRRGYRYSTTDPETDLPWPAMPAPLRELATAAALRAGFEDFVPDACLVNRYAPGTRLGLHQDRDEHDYTQPIVSVSLGLPATFLIGGLTRRGRLCHVQLGDGDVIVFGGPARLIYHGVKPLEAGVDPVLGAYRFNLTFRKAG
jgi:alkylated DNA repair protein (DNA oxidative demethylase)